MKKILITGKGSYIGNSFIKYCSQHNYEFEIDELSVYGDEWKNRDFSKYDVVFHVAGIAHATPGKKEAKLYYSINRDLAVKVAEHSKRNRVKQFIFMSSAIVYTSSNLDDGKVTEDTIPKSNNFYGDSKLEAEKGIKKLQDENFNIVILRPPMIYGKGSKGNFAKLSRLSQITPVFPNYDNKRSMLHVDNLSELISLIIKNADKGTYFPQNSEYVKTTDLVQSIANWHNKKIIYTKIANPIIRLLKKNTIINKLFGNFYYDKRLSEYEKGNYQVVNFMKSIELTESRD